MSAPPQRGGYGRWNASRGTEAESRKMCASPRPNASGTKPPSNPIGGGVTPASTVSSPLTTVGGPLALAGSGVPSSKQAVMTTSAKARRVMPKGGRAPRDRKRACARSGNLGEHERDLVGEHGDALDDRLGIERVERHRHGRRRDARDPDHAERARTDVE